MSRNPSDFYPTPPQAVGALVRWWHWDKRTAPDKVFDPCAGVGCLLVPWAECGADVVGSEIDPRVRGEAISPVSLGDGLEAVEGAAAAQDVETARGFLRGADLVVVNPPFKHADRWVRAVVGAAYRAHRSCAILLRSQWLDDGSTLGRQVYRHGMVPSAIVRLPWRISFDGQGQDSATYAWHIWDGYRLPGHAAYSDSDDLPEVRLAGACLTYWGQPATPTPESLDLWERGAALSSLSSAWQPQIPIV